MDTTDFNEWVFQDPNTGLNKTISELAVIKEINIRPRTSADGTKTAVHLSTLDNINCGIIQTILDKYTLSEVQILSKNTLLTLPNFQEEKEQSS